MTETAPTGDDENISRKELKLFGVDILKIECMRSSLLNGYVGAAVGGTGGFLFTSNWKTAANAAMGTYWLFALSAWFVCRYKSHKRKLEFKELKDEVAKKKIEESTYHLPIFLKEDVTGEEDSKVKS